MNQEEWLRINTFTCPHGLGRVSPEQCEANRKRKSVREGLSKVLKPFACETCTEWKELCEQVKRRREEMAKKIICRECGKEVIHHARGLCSSCYTKLKKEGRLPSPISEAASKAGRSKVVVSFKGHMELFEHLQQKAEQEVRTLSEQIIWELKKAILRGEENEGKRRTQI